MFIFVVIYAFLTQTFSALKMMHTTLWIVERWFMKKFLLKTVLISENTKRSLDWSKAAFVKSTSIITLSMCSAHEVITCMHLLSVIVSLVYMYIVLN